MGGRSRKRLLGVLLLLLIFFAPLAIGTVHPITRAILFVGCAAAIALALFDRFRRGKRVAITIPLVALCVAVGATAVQLVPLPSSIVARLSPHAHEVFGVTLGEDYGWHSLSLDPSGTLAELAKLGAYAAFLAAATIYGSRSYRRHRLLLAVVAVATVAALLGLAQLVLGSSKILFFYTPEAGAAIDRFARGPFVNPNHFGALLCLGAPCALAIGLSDRRLRVPALAAVVVMNLAIVLTVSRSTLVAAPLAQVLVFALDHLQRRRRSDGPAFGYRGALAIGAATAVAVAAAIGAERLVPELERTRTAELDSPLDAPQSKLRLWRGAVAMTSEYFWTGAGRGAFEQGFPQFNDRGGQARYPWLENIYLQVATDWGVPVAILLLLLAGWALVVAMRHPDSEPTGTGGLAALIGLAVHEAVDFAVELPGVAIPALTVVATLFARRSSVPEPGYRLVPVRSPALALPAALLAAVFCAAAWPTAEADARRLGARVHDAKVSTDEVVAAGERLRTRHPADFSIHLLVAARLAREQHPENLRSLPWLNDAMYLNPNYASPHLIAAELLAAGKQQQQAMIEYRLATGLASNPRTVWQRVAERFPGMDSLFAATPDDSALLVELGHWLMGRERVSDAEAAYARAVERDPANVEALQKLAGVAIGRRDAPAARHRREALLAVDRSVESRRIAIRSLVLEKDLPAAVAMADTLADRSSRTFLLELDLAHAYSQSGDRDGAIARLDRLNWDLDRAHRILLHETRADVERQAGNEHRYRWELEKAAKLRAP
ncbi:MAG: O-antigen ligase family protein [Deltaproteobacteria bacterium]|nr:O-antigen ligase family protein [Deltaproteobacteria bacterium]